MSQLSDDSQDRIFRRINHRFTLYVGVSSGGQEPRWDIASTKNISAGGALFTLDQEVKENEYLSIRLYFLDHLIECQGKVIHLTATGFKEPLLEVGIAFHGLNDIDKEYIEHYCRYHKE